MATAAADDAAVWNKVRQLFVRETRSSPPFLLMTRCLPLLQVGEQTNSALAKALDEARKATDAARAEVLPRVTKCILSRAIACVHLVLHYCWC